MSAVMAESNGTAVHSRWRMPLMIGGVAVVLIAALLVYLTGGRYMSTDDAYVQAARATISSNIAGQVSEILVRDNQRVHKGDVLFRLDPKPWQIAVDEAQAKLDTARMQITAGKAAYLQQMAGVRSAQDGLVYQQREYQRQAKLAESGATSQELVSQHQNDLAGAQQKLIAAQQQAASVLAMLAGKSNVEADQHPAVQQAQAELARAKLNLSYATIYAPDDGIVTKVEQLQVGDHINPAAPLFALISTRDVWIEANFKEDQLAYMKAGQGATIKVDSMPGHVLQAKVGSVAPGTGSQFSALPPENATGNWVKVVQRVPVRLELDQVPDDLVLGAGLSATVEVDTEHKRSLFGSKAAQ